MFYKFAEFQLDSRERTLIRDGKPITLTPKGFETLLFLVQNSGRVLEKDELMKALWPESFVEESNLSQNICVLRKALGDDQNGNSFIKTIPRRGYKFVAPVKHSDVLAEPTHSSFSADYWRRHSPFRGLQVFEPDDAWLFFGRDSETKDLLLRLRHAPTVVVIGNSGCGKSSLVRAGLIPALRSGCFNDSDQLLDSWRIAIIRPSGAPFDYLAEVLPNQLAPELSLTEQAEFIADCRNKLPQGREALHNAISALVNALTRESADTHILLVVDQFEELFTIDANHEIRERYIDALLAASRWDGSIPVHLVLALRADFYPHCLEYPALSRCLENNLYNVPRMNRGQLREAIEKRLALAGAQAECGLIDSLLDDVGVEPGDLALLEHALSQLWEKGGGSGCTLTGAAYSEIGRLRGALSVHANEVYSAIFGDTQRQLVKKIFLELVHLGEGAPDTRRRVRKEDLLSLGAPEEVEPLLARLASSRLISLGIEGQQTFAEVSHEALIREWAMLREWITNNRDELRLERKLIQVAQEWDGLNRDPETLLQGGRLAQGEEWLLRHPQVTPLVREYLEAGVAARVKAEGQRQRRLRWFSCFLAGLLLVALGGIWLVHKQGLQVESGALAAQSEEVVTRDQGRALDLAIRGWRTANTNETYIALTKALPQTLSILKHDGELTAAAFSPDGERILTASRDSTARLWTTTDGHPLIILQGHGGKIWDASFSPDGQRIVAGSQDHTAKVWNTADGRLLATLRGHTDAVFSVEFSSDGQRILTGSQDHTAKVWNTADGHLLATLQGHTDTVWDASFSPDHQRIATASFDGTARIWNAADGRLLATLQADPGWVLCAKFSPDSQRIVTASQDRTARIWNAASGRLLITLNHDGAVSYAKFSPDGRRIITASYDHTARIWNADDGHLLTTLHHDGPVNHAAFSSDGHRIITASYDHTGRVWNATDGHLLATLQGHTASVYFASFSPDGQHILTGSQDNTARVWSIVGGRTLTTLQGHTGKVWRAVLSPDGQRILTTSSDHTARIWNTSGRLLATLHGHTDLIGTAGFSPDSQRLITASHDHTARVWNTNDGRLVAILHHEDAVVDAKFSPDGRRIVTASWDRTARVWNSSDGHLLVTLKGHSDAIVRASFSSDGQRIVTASIDHTARVWSTTDGHPLIILQGHGGKIWDASFSPDGQRIVTASLDHTARVWNTADGRLLAILQGHTDAIIRAVFSPDGQHIVTASNDHTARVWSTTDSRLLATLQGHTDQLWDARFSPDGQCIVTASLDHTARVWNTADGRLLAILQGHTDAIIGAVFSPDGQSIVTASADQTARVWQIVTLEDIEKLLTH